MDRPVTREYLKCPLYKEAVEIVLEEFREALEQPPMTLDGALRSMDLTKASGYVLRQSGYKKKYQAVMTGVVFQFLSKGILDEIPLWLACGKEREFLYRSDYIGDKKQRTFIVEPFELLLHHKIIYGNQSEGMKGHWWSAYGLNPYQGGVNNMARKLLRYRRFTMFDVVRYDRLFPHMRDVFYIRNECVADSPFKEWVTNNCCDSMVVLPNGDVIFKTWGNNSGSGTTTGDNIIGMAICLVHAFLRLGCDHEQISEMVWAYLFGDDVVLADSLDCSDEELKEVLISTFALYGFKFDPLIISNKLEDMEFLGFKFVKMGDFWVPKYDLGVLCFGFTHNHDTVDKLSEISKFGSLMLMSAGHGEEVYNKFRVELLKVLVNFDHVKINGLKHNNFAGVPTFEETLNWYVGYESNNSSSFHFLLDDIIQTEVDGVQMNDEES